MDTFVISNASPLITLAKSGMIDILHQQFSKVLVPNAVRHEILAGPDDDPMRNMIDLPWLESVRLEPPLSPLAYWNLGRGESEVIEYARLNPVSIALLDDRTARNVAESLNLKVCGTLSIVARQATHDPLFSFDHAVERLKNAGLYLNEKLIESMRVKLVHPHKK